MAETYNFPDVKTRTTFDGLDIQLIVNETGIDLQGASIALNISADKGATISKKLTNGAGITVTDAAEGKITINPFMVDLKPKTYNYELVVEKGSDVKVRMEGKWNVLARMNF
jgi:hypothetical protein